MDGARRAPQQERSRQTVDRIVEAAAIVLARDGYAQASTNRIARAAGISPGSLYQYFDGKDAIVAEVTRRLVVEFASTITPALRRAASQPRDEAATSLLDAVLSALERHADLLRSIADRIPAAEQSEALQDLRVRLTDVVLGLFVVQGARASDDELEQAAWLVVETAEHLTVRYVLDAPPIPRERFIAALVAVIDTLSP